MEEEPNKSKQQQQKQKKANTNVVIPPKKPKLSKAERRALQESQRAAKAAASDGNKKPSSQPEKKPERTQPKQQQAVKKQPTEHTNVVKDPASNKSFSLFSHLPPYRDPTDVISVVDTKLPHEVLVLGQKYAEGTIMGGNARCRAMLHTFKQLVEQYQPGPNVRDIRNAFYHSLLKPAFQHWTEKCRPHCVSMGNAFSFLKAAAAALDRDMSLDEMKEELADTMDRYIKERIEYAGVAITSYASSKIMDGDVILTFGRSEVVQEILLDCANKKTIHVICSDSRPLLEGKQMLEPLTKAGIPCSYVLLNALSHVMRNATKVLLGASAIMSNGSIMSRVGTACVALMAHSHHVPVLVCCESYKISHRIQLESITSNELGNPDGASGKELKDWITTPNLRLLNLLYDLTPSQYVSGIITEMGIVPPTSVAVLLRELNKQDQAVVVD